MGMTYVLVAACAVFVLAPALAFWLFFMRRQPLLLILALGSAFAWVVALLLTSLVWWLTFPLRNVFLLAVLESVFFQELFRWLFFRGYLRIEPFFRAGAAQRPRVADNQERLETWLNSAAVGYGFGVAQVFIMYIGLLFDAFGPATLPSEHCPSFSVFTISAFQCLLFLVIHVALGVVAWPAYRARNVPLIAVVVGGHAVMALLSLLNVTGLCLVGFFSGAVVLALLLAVAVRVTALVLKGELNLGWRGLPRRMGD